MPFLRIVKFLIQRVQKLSGGNAGKPFARNTNSAVATPFCVSDAFLSHPFRVRVDYNCTFVSHT